MTPSAWLKSLTGHYPEPASFDPGVGIDNIDYKRFASMWLLEGVPFAFLNCPGVFQAAREKMANELGVTFRDISMTGSARIGYSMNPQSFGQIYGAGSSDIDLFLVNNRVFEVLAQQALKFCEEFKSGSVTPRNDKERLYWPENTRLLPKKIEEGLVDAKKIPTLDRYPASKKLNNACFSFRENVNVWSGQQLIGYASLRVYKDWAAAVEQIAFNLKSSLKYRN